VSDVLRSLNGTASKCKTFLATATEECCPARGTLAGHFTRRLSPQGREYNSSGLTCHLKEAVRARNSIEPLPSLTPRSKNGMRIQLPKPRANRTTTGGTCKRAQTKNQADFPIGRKTKRNSSGKWELLRSSVHRKRVPHLSNLRGIISSRRNSHRRFGDMNGPSERAAKAVSPIFIGKSTVLIWSSLREKPYRHGELRRLGCPSQPIRTRALRNLESAARITRSVTGSKSLAVDCPLTLGVKKSM